MSETAGSLRAWAETEMGYSGTVSAENLSSICRGSMKEVWSWIISHCLDRERVRTIQGNLILMKKKVEGKLIFRDQTHSFLYFLFPFVRRGVCR